MMQAPPPPPVMIVQNYYDTNSAVNSALSRLNASTSNTTSSAQRPVDTLSIEYYLKNKYLGLTTTITGVNRQSIGQARVVGISKSEGKYQCTISSRQGQTLVADVVFEGRLSDAPTQKRWGMSAATAQGRKRTVEIENQLNTEIAVIGSDSLGMSSASLVSPETTPEPTADLLPTGEAIQVIDLGTGASSVQNVVIYRGAAYLSNGVPLTVRLEYQP